MSEIITVGIDLAKNVMGLSNRSWDVKHEVVGMTLPGAWLSSRSTLAAA